MNIIQQFITKNDCYKQGKTITPKGIMVHSTATPGVMAKDWFSRWNKSGLDVAVHCFVDDQNVCQHLPWNYRAWHCGASGNNTHISFELCEPTNWKTDSDYFCDCYRQGVALAAYLCQKYNLTADAICSHKEGYKRSIASNHGDPEHWWSNFGYSMDQFRKDVAATLKGETITVTVVPPTLSVGDTGSAVTALQKRLNQVAISLALSYAPLDEDGIFGTKTKEAVRAFQSARKLTVDGIVGEKTHAALAISYGDVNRDGAVNANDALAVLRSAVGKQVLDDEQKAAGDMNADGKVNAVDAAQILKRAVSTK